MIHISYYNFILYFPIPPVTVLSYFHNLKVKKKEKKMHTQTQNNL